jgi:hypothetical protein
MRHSGLYYCAQSRLFLFFLGGIATQFNGGLRKKEKVGKEACQGGKCQLKPKHKTQKTQQ